MINRFLDLLCRLGLHRWELQDDWDDDDWIVEWYQCKHCGFTRRKR